MLDEAYAHYKAGDESDKPNSFIYFPIIDPQGPFKAEAILERMQEEGCHTDKILYAHVIGSYSKLETRQGAEQAEALLRNQWNRLGNGSIKSLTPHTNLCNTITLAWANSQAVEDEAPKRALGIFEEMVKRAASRGDRFVTPTCTTYNVVLSFSSKSGNGQASGSISAAQEAQNWMDDLWN